MQSVAYRTVDTDQLTFNTDKGAFPRKLVHEILGGLWGGARATLQTLFDMKLLHRWRPQLLQILVTDWALCKVA